MNDLTLEEKIENAESRAREVEAEKHFFDKAQPHYPLGFSVTYRNHGHWDISADQCPGAASAWLASHPGGSTSARDGQRERAFCIRGEPGNVYIRDERWDPHRPHPRESMKFRTVASAMAWIVDDLMREPGDIGDRETLTSAAEAIRLFTGHDCDSNLKSRFGDKWWDQIKKLEHRLRRMAGADR